MDELPAQEDWDDQAFIDNAEAPKFQRQRDRSPGARELFQ